VINVSAILIHDTLQTTSPFTDDVISEAPWQCTSLQHDASLTVQPSYGVIYPDLKSGLLGLDAGEILTPQVRDRVSGNVR